MASRWYLRPSASSEANTVLPYHPSAPFALEEAFPAGTSLPPAPPPVPRIIAARNDDAIRVLAHEVRGDFQEDGELMRRIRARQQAWSDYDAAEGGGSDAGDGYQKLTKMDRMMPKAFQFQRDQARMHRLWSDAHPSSESAIARPVPCHLLQTPHPTCPGSSSANKSTTSPSPAASRMAQPPLILTISVYSRHVLRSTRQSRARAAAEKRYDEFQQEQNSKFNNLHHASSTPGDLSESEMRPETMEKNLFLPKFGTFRDEKQADPRPSQRLEMHSDQTLLDLCEGIICRMDDLPERDEDIETNLTQADADAAKPRGIDAKDRTRYTGKKRVAEKVVLVESYLAGRPDSSLLEHVHQQLTSQSDTDEQMEKVGLASVTMGDLFGKLCLHKPYWYCHQGICEHFFTIDEIRLPDPKSDPPPISPAQEQSEAPFAAQEQVYRHPMTTYLMAAQLSRPTATIARLRGAQETYSLGYCTICDKLTAKFAVVGGERTGSEGADVWRRRRKRGREQSERERHDQNAEAEGEEEHLPPVPALKSEVELLCPACLAALTGHVLPLPQPRGKGKDNAALPVEEADEPTGDGPQAKRKYTRRAKDVATTEEHDAQDAEGLISSSEQTTAALGLTAGHGEEQEEQRGLPSAITAENLRRNAQMVSDDFNIGWHEAVHRLRGGAKGWTIVPLLD
ncbi:hypothetical protein BCV69DRAFT_194864 [Microstroma glucosiphilum]|uniref:snRNA-activating protein complex subunit 3 n=1 Tax=Pseudomicrostroma glucosiphilum TaxID=1684307 RepID=A0A316U602_9BASI|nr:hypothetical protein BCV69DRAFT_194864 [Pseudomicrostroma glucosiphilum]PWN20642.1 hypothetical protein BCV69DRAFT_194864 [Pseudomicrostroma glucosiphilum]